MFINQLAILHVLFLGLMLAWGRNDIATNAVNPTYANEFIQEPALPGSVRRYLGVETTPDGGSYLTKGDAVVTYEEEKQLIFVCSGELTSAHVARLKEIKGLVALEVTAQSTLSAECISSLGSLSSLQYLMLDIPGKLGDVQWNKWTALTELRGLWLSSAWVSEQSLSFIFKLDQVETLALASDPLSEAFFESLSRLRKLRGLELQAPVAVSAEHLSRLGGSKVLCSLKIANANLNEQCPELPPALTHLYVNNNGLRSDAILARCSKLSNLRFIAVLGAAFSAASLHSLCREGVLEGIDIGGQDLSDAHLKELAQIGTLRTVALVGSNKITDAGLSELQNLRYLYSLDASECGLLTGHGLDGFSKCINFAVLYLIRCNRFEAAALRAMSKLRVLETLGISGKNLKDEDLGDLENLASLQELVIDPAPNLSNKVFEFLTKLKRLTVLRLWDAPNISKESIPKALRERRGFVCEVLTRG